jgi:hypothetical protein
MVVAAAEGADIVICPVILPTSATAITARELDPRKVGEPQKEARFGSSRPTFWTFVVLAVLNAPLWFARRKN